MNFVISDEILESLVCVSCLKYLSVPPVKIYPGKYIKCGRCSREGDSGVISSYGILAEKSLFRCINKFDGCRQLLESSQVMDHEAECEASEYACPCCLNSVVPTYLLLNHFGRKHPSAVLRRPIFSVDLKGEPQSEFEKIFFYRLKDDLFLVLFRFHAMENEIYLNAYYFGEGRRAERIKQKFFVHCTGVELIMESREKPCIPYSKYGKVDSDELEGFSMKLTSLSVEHSIFIEMEVNVSEIAEIFTVTHPTNAAQPECIKSTSTRSTITTPIRRKPKSTNTAEPVVNTAGKNNLENFRSLSAVCYEKDVIFPRKLFLTPYFRKNYVEFSTDLDFYKLIKGPPRGGEVVLSLPCFICSELNFSINSYRKSVFLRNHLSYFWLCSPCYQFHKRTDPSDKSKFSHAWAVLDYDVYSYIQFFCMWGCATPLYYTALPKHETDCVSQPTQWCPVEQCVHLGKLFEIENHFAGKHTPRQLVSLRSTFITKLNRDEGYVFEWYVWTPPFFVLVKLVWNNARWSIDVNTCEQHPGIQPRVVFFDKEWEFLETVGSTDNGKYIEDRKEVGMKCFLKCE